MVFSFHSLLVHESVVVALDCRHFPPPWVVEEQSGVSVAIVLQSSMLFREKQGIAKLALEENLPTVFGYQEHVESGGLISYGVDLRWCYYRSAYFVDKILRGSPPGDLPVEFPTKLVLAINVKTAKALGITVPPSLLATADEVIE
jgi:putative tryptophan/tyrosine transport system substrate-binding protein